MDGLARLKLVGGELGLCEWRGIGRMRTSLIMASSWDLPPLLMARAAATSAGGATRENTIAVAVVVVEVGCSVRPAAAAGAAQRAQRSMAAIVCRARDVAISGAGSARRVLGLVWGM